ncbi:hypothetical protein O181_100096 [Austropuccinia psidii MF-1]|uniref:Tf2-1-like SH3-like domain-containing protein n=1 Tax=Austropuccinia psidii MF-1 TaxID=1389203 RepID=A0A9Q3JE45_9BASI|nr:hypothetical protein [Austropuccinia psidii MF-1]
MQMKVEQVHLSSILVTWYGFPPRKSNQPDPPKKLSERWLGPFPILKKVSTYAYNLKLPSQWKSIHPVFHISLLEPVKKSTIPTRHQDPPPPITIEEGEEWVSQEEKIMVSGGMERFQ